MRGNKLLRFLDFYLGIPLSFFLSLFLRRGKGFEQTPQRIIVSKFAGLGDAILLLPSLRALRKLYPDAEITLLGSTLTESFLRNFPRYVDRFVTLDVKALVRPRYLLKTIQSLRSYRYDLAIDSEQWARATPVLFALSGMPARLGFNTPGQYRHYAFSKTVDHSPSHHELDNFLRLIERLGAQNPDRTITMPLEPALVSAVKESLSRQGWRSSQRLIVFHPGCGTHGFPREWPPENFGRLATELARDGKIFCVVAGTSSEYPVVARVGEMIPAPSAFFMIDGLARYAALLSISSLFVSGNNGAMHLAAALGVSQVALHGPTNPKRWGPVNPRAAVVQSHCAGCPCLHLGFEYHRVDGYCMQHVGVDDVYRACVEALRRPR